MTDLDYFVSAIGHPLRRQILQTVYENPKISYSQILARVNISSGKLNFHLQKLDRFLTQVDGQYRISDKGLMLFRTMGMLERRLSGKEYTSPKMPGLFVGRRFFAFIIDVTIILTVLFVAADPTSLIMSTTWWSQGLPVPTFLIRIVDMLITYPEPNVVLIRAYIFAVLWMYFTLMEGYRGQSLGKMILGIRIVDMSGARMTPHEAAVRSLAKVLILPIDIIVGLIKSRKAGFLRFFGQYTRTWVLRI
ncbi:MAG: RDD family protein [Promethearchaeota archaeon]